MNKLKFKPECLRAQDVAADATASNTGDEADEVVGEDNAIGEKDIINDDEDNAADDEDNAAAADEDNAIGEEDNINGEEDNINGAADADSSAVRHNSDATNNDMEQEEEQEETDEQENLASSSNHGCKYMDHADTQGFVASGEVDSYEDVDAEDIESLKPHLYENLLQKSRFPPKENHQPWSKLLLWSNVVFPMMSLWLEK